MNRNRRQNQEPRPLDDSLRSLSQRLGMGDARGTGRLFSAWSEIVGPAMAEHAQPVKLEGSTLVIVVDHPAWATQIRHLSNDLLARVGTMTGVPAPTHLDIRIRR